MKKASLKRQILKFMLGRGFLFRLPADPWERIPYQVYPEGFARGSRVEFSSYLEGTSRVSAATVQEICQWLTSCTLKPDSEQCDESDVWLHPLEFEFVQQGDCEDHALWAWRKLVESGITADLVCGKLTNSTTGQQQPHCWVCYVERGIIYVLECTRKNTAEMIIPLDLARKQYSPEVSVDHELRTYVYSAYYRSDC